MPCGQGQTLTSATSLILSELEPVLRSDRPDLVLVQGDTATTLAGALAAFYARIPVGHIEAGLRTGDMAQPFPEEMNRVVVGRLSALHFAATPWAAANLRAEGSRLRPHNGDREYRHRRGPLYSRPAGKERDTRPGLAGSGPRP